nr:ESCRT-II complex, vps25 subunit [Ipomoea batatas]
MDIVESIQSLVVQNPPGEDFSSADLNWTKFGSAEHQDEVALIPYDRVDAFIIGECSNVECPTRFHIERGRKRVEGSLKEYRPDEYLEYRMYWCSFGPENYGEGGGILPSRRYRLNTRNRAARPQSMRGCTCHFVVKRLYACPSLALLIFNNRRHVNKSGFVCHGPLDRDAIGPGAKKIPYICNEIQQQTMSMIYLGIPEENVLEKHIEGIQRYCNSDAKVNSLASQYVQKLGMIIKRSTHELDLDDQASIRMWVERNKKSVFIYQDPSEKDPFILGIQTEWQLQQMIRFGHRSIIAADSTFGIKKLKYPLCTVLVFDSRQHALPVAWIITQSIAKLDVSKWMKALFSRVHTTDPAWKANGFLIDDAAIETDPIRQVSLLNGFSCPLIFSLWRIRRSWLRNICKKCGTIEVQREIFKRLGDIVYSIWGGGDPALALEELTRDFVDQTAFMQYFTSTWVPKIEMWLTTMKTFPLASQESSGAIEAYHVKLKAKLYDDSHLGALQRVDWLVHKLTTELHSSYWLDRYADESDSFQNVKEEYIASTSWYRALQIPDAAVSFESRQQSQHHFAKPMDDSVALDLSTAWTQQMLDQIQKLMLWLHARKRLFISMVRQVWQPSDGFTSGEELCLKLSNKHSSRGTTDELSTSVIIKLQNEIWSTVHSSGSIDIPTCQTKPYLQFKFFKASTILGVKELLNGSNTLPLVEKADSEATIDIVEKAGQ